MDYRKYHDTYYIRMDKGDEIIEKIYDVCKKEYIASAVYSGIGGCSGAEIQIKDPLQTWFTFIILVMLLAQQK